MASIASTIASDFGSVTGELPSSTPVDNTAMSSPQVLQNLVRVVLRSFYEDRHIILVDFLLSERVLSDEELADRLRLVLKEVNRMAAKLREDRLIKM
jgi:transcription initiation factor TFIIE subunit alpha